MNHTELNDIATRILAIDEQVSSLEKIKAALQVQLTALVGVKEEGSTTVRTDRFKLTTTGKLNRTVDSNRLTEAWLNLPKEAQDAFSWKASVSVKALHELEKYRPDVARDISAYITVKPAKATLSIEAIPAEQQQEAA